MPLRVKAIGIFQKTEQIGGKAKGIRTDVTDLHDWIDLYISCVSFLGKVLNSVQAMKALYALVFMRQKR
jgi:hypothetical protein